MRIAIEREHVILWGAALGLAIAIVGSIDGGRWNEDTVVRVNGVAIPREAFDLAAERFGASTPYQSSAALSLLVDEELLVQRAETVGLISHDRTIKKAVVRAVLERLTDRVRTLGRDSHEFKSFWEQRSAHFLRGTSKTQTIALAEREFRIRFPDILLSELLANLRARADIAAPDAAGEPSNEIAVRVNDVDIPVELVTRFLDALTESRREEASHADLEYALGRVVDEELLFQYGLETGIHRSDREVRGVIRTIMVDTITIDSEVRPETGDPAAAFETYIKRLRSSARIEWPDWIAPS